jgi:hypothetical protein
MRTHGTHVQQVALQCSARSPHRASDAGRVSRVKPARQRPYSRYGHPGVVAYLLQRLQSVLNAAVRSIAGLRRSAPVNKSFASLNWLQATERAKFKLASLTYHCLQRTVMCQKFEGSIIRLKGTVLYSRRRYVIIVYLVEISSFRI